MEIDWGSVLPPLVTVGAILATWWRLDTKIDRLDTKLSGEIRDVRGNLSGEIKDVRGNLSGEIKDVRQASFDAHVAIRQDLTDIKVQQAANIERLKCIESHLDVSRPED